MYVEVVVALSTKLAKKEPLCRLATQKLPVGHKKLPVGKKKEGVDSITPRKPVGWSTKTGHSKTQK